MPRTGNICALNFVLCAFSSLLVALPACTSDQHFSQTELTTLQSREFDAAYDRTYEAAINALFDARYVIRSSDKDAGFVSASRVGGDSWSGYAHQIAQVKLSAAGRRTAVRISTTDGTQQRLDKKQIDELLNLIDRRLVGDLSVPAAAVPPQGPGR